jgi:hypothetical protein
MWDFGRDRKIVDFDANAVVDVVDVVDIINVVRVKRLLRNITFPGCIVVQLVAAVISVVVVVVVVVGWMVVVVSGGGQSFSSAKIDDFVVLGLEVQRQVTTLPSESAQSTLEGSTQMLDLLSVVDGQQVSTHFRILRL